MSTIYWITRLDAINTLVWIMFGFAICVFILLFIFYVVDLFEGDEKNKDLVSVMKTCGIVSIICLIFGIFVPTTKEAVVIYGGGKILNYVESNEKLQNMPDKVVALTDEYIDTLNRKLNGVENKEEQ